MPQLFFSSYAHVNRDRLLEKFVDRLRHEVLQRAQGNLKPEDVAFFDSEGIQTGEEWIKKLSDAVCNCKVCVAICSPAYVCSEFCGKEIGLFLERLRQWEKLPENRRLAGRPPIIPVIWVKTVLPRVLRQFQYDEHVFPREYLEHGLRTLCQLKGYQDKRTRIVITLAQRIVDGAETDLPSIGPIPHFDHIGSVFHEQRRGTPYGVALVALVKGDVDARPYGQAIALRNFMDDACGGRIPWWPLEQDGTLDKRIREAKVNREGVLIIADLETLEAPLFKKVVAAVDAEAGEQSAILIMRNEEPSSSAAEERQVEITLNGHFPKAFQKVWHRDWNSIRSADKLRQMMEETIVKLRSRLVEEDPPRQACDPALAAAAIAGGVPIERQPVLTGPGGKGS